MSKILNIYNRSRLTHETPVLFYTCYRTVKQSVVLPAVKRQKRTAYKFCPLTGIHSFPLLKTSLVHSHEPSLYSPYPSYEVTGGFRSLSSSSPLKKTIDTYRKKTGGQEEKETSGIGRKRNRDVDDTSPQILLIENEDKMVSVSLKQAERIAKRRDLKLVQTEDEALRGKTSRLVYKLITGKEYHEISKAKKEAAKSSEVKGEKNLTVNGKIAANDLNSKLSNIEKWIKKGFLVKVTIASKGASSEDMENVYSKIEESATSVMGRILQRREKFGDLKFYVSPSKEKKADRRATDKQEDA